MARPSNLANLSVDALLKLREQIGAVLSKKAEALKSQLALMSGGRDMALFMRGAQELKTAVERTPDDVTVRIVLGLTAQNVPPQAHAFMGVAVSPRARKVAVTLRISTNGSRPKA